MYTCIVHTSVAQNNELVIGWDSNGVMTLLVNSDIKRLNAVNAGDLFVGWHKHCFTWKKSGSIKVCYL